MSEDCDGIGQLDNPIPRWWVRIFVATFVFGVGYFYIAITTGQLDPVVAYDNQVAQQLKAQLARGELLDADAPTLLKLMRDPQSLKLGAQIFQANCVTCHGHDGGGAAAPNLTDQAYLNVRTIDDIPDIVTRGRNNQTMPAWSARLTANEIVLVSAYTASLRGQNRPGRAEEGRPIAPWTE